MLELKDITLTIGQKDAAQDLLSEITLRLPPAHFAAIIGPSGCGKSTLLKAITGIKSHTRGSIHWNERDLEADGDMDPHEIGYVPQFSIAHELLTVKECVESSLRLRVSNLTPDELAARIEKVLGSVGLNEIGDRRVALISGGQKRRLGMAIEMSSSPSLLLCDEVTSGLDPKSEDEIVKLMHLLAQSDGRIVLSVTHSLQHVSLHDSVIVLYEGVLAYHGSPKFITHYFGITRPEDLYLRLAERKAHDWRQSWHKHRPAYYEQSGLPPMTVTAPPVTAPPKQEEPPKPEPAAAVVELSEADELERLRGIVEKKQKGEPSEPAPPPIKKPEPKRKSPSPSPSIFTQFSVLLSRRWKLFFRDRGQVLLQLALLFGFPCLVVIFALDGLEPVKNFSTQIGASFLEQAMAEKNITIEVAQVGTLVSGLIMFQVILLALMGSNNSAREVAAERNLFEKEKFAGLSPLAYVASKVTFLGALVVAQSVWMTVFVNMIVGFQGEFVAQVMSLVLINAAITFVCLGISSWLRSAEQSSLLSMYLVGFQLPLSGVVLALPKAIATVTQIFIASYWGWSGFIRSMESTRYYDAIKQVTQTEPAGGFLCTWVLLAHVVIGIFFTYTGCKNSRWE